MDSASQIVIDVLPTKGEYKVPNRNYLIIIHLDKMPVAVTLNENFLNSWNFDSQKRILEVTVAKQSDEKICVKISK